jgi:hypothetical protein
MAYSRLLRTNRIEDPTASLLNGTGGGAPARDEVSGYVMENVMYADRRSLWKLSGGASLEVDFRLTSGPGDTSIAAAALLGHRPTTSSGSGITTCTVRGATNAAGYPPGAWTDLGVISMSGKPRNGGVTFAPTSIRYLRFSITCADNFTLGRIWGGQINTDLGQLCAADAGASRRYIVPSVDMETVGGENYRTYLSDDPHIEASLPFRDIGTTEHDALVTNAQLRQSLIWIDNANIFREGYLRLTDGWKWDGVFDADVEFVELG